MSDHLASWLRRSSLDARAEQQVARIVMEAGAEAPAHPSAVKLPGDPWALRGIPAVGVRGGVGGAIPGTLPHNVR